jgi:O-antigen/teichoic acid export membrane protein
MARAAHTALDALSGEEASRRSGRSLLATLSTQSGRFCLQLCSTVLLARLLPPADFGLIAMAMVLTNFVGVFRDVGLTQATVQAASIEHSQINALFWLNVGLSLSLFIVVSLAAPLLAWIYGDPRLLCLTIVLGATIALSGPGLQHLALLQRNLKFGKIARADLLANSLALAAGLCAALYGAGYWAIAWMAVIHTATNSALLWHLSDWRPSRTQWSDGMGALLRFGGHLSGFSFVNYFSRNADNFLIGKFIGLGALGHYSKAYQLMMLPIQQINGPISAALIPTLSRLQDQPSEFAALYLKWAGRIAWLTAIPIASMVYFGEDLVVFLLGDAWQPAGELFQWLALASVLQPLSNFMGVCFIATGQTRRMFYWGCASSSVIVMAFGAGLGWGGVTGLAIAYAVISNLLFPLLVHYSLTASPIAITDYYRRILCPSLIALTLCMVALRAA